MLLVRKYAAVVVVVVAGAQNRRNLEAELQAQLDTVTAQQQQTHAALERAQREAAQASEATARSDAALAEFKAEGQ